MIFVAAISENKLFHIDPIKMEKISETRFFCEGVHSIKMDHNRQFIYTADTYSKSVSAIDMIKNEKMTAGAGTSPTHLEFCKKNGLLYVANYDSDSISLINAETLENVMTVKTGSMPHHICLSDDENYIYVLQMGNNSILAINTDTNEICGQIRLDSTPMHMRIGQNTGRIYVACTNFEKTTSGEIVVIDKNVFKENTSDGEKQNVIYKKIKRYQIGKYLFDLCVIEEDMRIYAIDGQENKLYMLSLTDGQIVNEIKTGDFPSTIEYDKESDRIFVGTHIENLIEAYDRKDLSYVGKIELNSDFGHIAK